MRPKFAIQKKIECAYSVVRNTTYTVRAVCITIVASSKQKIRQAKKADKL